MTDISIIGSGNMARGIATRAATAGHQVQILARDQKAADALATEIGGSAGAIGDPLRGSIVVLALPYDAVGETLRQLGGQLNGKTLVDITNPVDYTTFAGLVVPRDSSAAAEIAKQAPAASVVKAFNTVFAGTLLSGEVAGNSLDVLLAGDDEDAKRAFSEFVTSTGLRPIDAGDLSAAHWLEGIGFLHMKIQNGLGTSFNTAVKIVS
ncbi:NADPH-dependent F420 reductase [Streptomyces liangshanensis]|uniref:NADPH-dependent F420 reductase n=1 Tax=Streptomyces liangshanensis TaxID=2717324 RepID=UPI0036DADBF2